MNFIKRLFIFCVVGQLSTAAMATVYGSGDIVDVNTGEVSNGDIFIGVDGIRVDNSGRPPSVQNVNGGVVTNTTLTGGYAGGYSLSNSNAFGGDAIQNVYEGGTVINTILTGGGSNGDGYGSGYGKGTGGDAIQNVYAGGTVINTTLTGGYGVGSGDGYGVGNGYGYGGDAIQNLYEGGIATNTTLTGGIGRGYATDEGNGTGYNNGYGYGGDAIQNVYAGGIATNTTLTGGNGYSDDPGQSKGYGYGGAAIQNVDGGSAYNTTFAGNAGELTVWNGGYVGGAINVGCVSSVELTCSTANAAISATDSMIEADINFFDTDGSTLSLKNSTLKGQVYGQDVMLSSMSMDASLWIMTGNSSVGNLSLTNASTVMLGGSTETAPHSLTVAGDYTGNTTSDAAQNSTIVFNGAFAPAGPASNTMLVEGNATGSTNVSVNKIGMYSAKELDHHPLITVDQGQNAFSAATFSQQGRIVSGAYEYTLLTDGATVNGKQEWYLSSSGLPHRGTNTPGTPVTRPEGGAYIANLAAANTLFNTTLHDRLGETHYVDALTGEQAVTSLWLRQAGGHNSFKDSSSQNQTQANRYILQLGGDIAQWSSDGLNRFHLGVMGGYANQHSNTYNNRSGHNAEGVTSGYSAGLYGTWFQDDAEKTGAYVDSWVLYNWFDSDVTGEGFSTESWKSRGTTASLETGYTWKVGERNERKGYFIQPQAQLVWMNVRASSHTEENGTRVDFDGDGNLLSRLGVRAFIKGHREADTGKSRVFEPFVEANWLHNSQIYGVLMNGVGMSQAGARNIGELKAGLEAKLNNSVSLWGNVAQQIGSEGYSDTQAMLGTKISFR